jgi:hypothetical protein
MSIKVNIKEFNKNIDKIMDNVEKGVRDGVMVKVCMDALRTLQGHTPFKTGRAKAGWNPQVDAAPSDWKPLPDKGYYQPMPFHNATKITYKSTVHLSNNVEYIVPLEKGHSKQRPKGIVGPSLNLINTQLAVVAKAESMRVIK